METVKRENRANSEREIELRKYMKQKDKESGVRKWEIN